MLEQPPLKPIVYIDLIGTLGQWEEQDPPISESYAFQTLPKLEYQDTKLIALGIKPTILSYTKSPENCSNFEGDADVQEYRKFSIIANYKKVLEELKVDCLLRLISTANKATTLAINEQFNLGFDKREIITREDIPKNMDDQYIGERLCPESILISNQSLDSKASSIQRQALGIEREQQIMLQMLKIKALELPTLKNPNGINTNNHRVDLNTLSEELDIQTKTKPKRPDQYLHAPGSL